MTSDFISYENHLVSYKKYEWNYDKNDEKSFQFHKKKENEQMTYLNFYPTNDSKLRKEKS